MNSNATRLVLSPNGLDYLAVRRADGQVIARVSMTRGGYWTFRAYGDDLNRGAFLTREGAAAAALDFVSRAVAP